MKYLINTSNKGKLEEFERLFRQKGHTIEVCTQDLKEIEAPPLTVVVHKASQLGPGFIVEDTSLEVEGFTIGIKIRTLCDQLPLAVGRRARWLSLIALHCGSYIKVFEGCVSGHICALDDCEGKEQFGFDAYFIPEGKKESLSREKPDSCNARALALEQLFEDEPCFVSKPLKQWEGPWQKPESDTEFKS